MITVRGRELVIPIAERQIGTQYDNNSETRQFKINRLTVGGIDISNLDFHIDLRYGKEIKDTDILTKEVSDEYVILTWTVSAASVKQVGTVFIALRGSDDFGTVKWATNQGYLYVGDTINTPEGTEIALSELEKLEKRIDKKTETMDAAESSREEAEKIRQENETARKNNETEWQKQGEAAVEAAKTASSAASEAKTSAEEAAGSAGAARTSAEDAAADASELKELLQGWNGFNGKASSVSAVDLLGLLGTQNAESTVQALIDAIADKVLNQLLLRSNVVNNALTTEEGYALDARMGKSLQDQINTQNSNLSNIGTVVTATGVYTTATWETGTNTAVLTLPSAGNYIIIMTYELQTETAEARSIYIQTQIRSNRAILPFGRNSWVGWYFDDLTAGYDSRINYENTIFAINAQSGDVIYPYVHTSVAGVQFNVNIFAMRI